MKRLTLFFLTLIFPLLATAEIKPPKTIAAEAKAQIDEVSMEVLRDWMADSKDILLVDVRTAAEYEAGHLEGAVWIPRGRLEFDIQKRTTDPQQPIVVYCRTGGRGALSALALEAVGYENVKSLAGGFKEWVEAGMPAFTQHGEVKFVEYGKQEKQD
jgi:rhodanese-related sulfurtransferase